VTGQDWSSPECEQIARLLVTRTGLAFSPPRIETAEAGMQRAMTRAGVTDLARYRTLLEHDADAFDDLVVELSVGETYFFREPAQFAVIRRDILPEIRRRRGAQHVPRVWSAACASGEEAYSLAIVLFESGLGEHVPLLATDISRTALAKARRAIYGRWSLRGDGAAAAGAYLRPVRDQYHLDERVRRCVTVQYLNLALDTYPSLASGVWGMDLILCRNALIYFDQETVRQVARRLFASLADSGWLVTGPSDPPLAGEAPYETVATAAGVLYRRPPRSASPELTLPSPPRSAAASAAERSAQGAGANDPMSDGNEWMAFGATATAGGSEPPSATPVADARAALLAGDYARAIRLTRGPQAAAEASALCVRALANVDPVEAERACAAAVARHAFSPELHFLRAVLLLNLGRDEEAARALRHVLYLDRSLAAAHFVLGAILRRRGDLEDARRAYRNARDLCAARPPDEVLPLTDGEPTGRLAEAADVELALLVRGEAA